MNLIDLTIHHKDRLQIETVDVVIFVQILDGPKKNVFKSFYSLETINSAILTLTTYFHQRIRKIVTIEIHSFSGSLISDAVAQWLCN